MDEDKWTETVAGEVEDDAGEDHEEMTLMQMAESDVLVCGWVGGMNGYEP